MQFFELNLKAAVEVHARDDVFRACIVWCKSQVAQFKAVAIFDAINAGKRDCRIRKKSFRRLRTLSGIQCSRRIRLVASETAIGIEFSAWK